MKYTNHSTMGDTKAEVSRPLRLARYILAGFVFLFAVIAIIQLSIFPMITIKFETGYGAQQLAAMQVKKGSNVELPIPLKPGSYFVGWSLSKDSDIVIDNLQNVNDGTTLYAVWDGVEKYSVLMVNNVLYDQINILETQDTGITPAQLNERWRLPDDYDPENTHLTKFDAQRFYDPHNNFQKFLGWRYRNVDNTDNELLYDNGVWTWVQRDAEGKATTSVITDENKFYTPNYRTTFHAILQYRQVRLAYYLPGDPKVAVYSEFLNVGDDSVTLPNPQDLTDDKDSVSKFAYWEIKAGKFAGDQYTTSGLRELLLQTTTDYVAGARVKVDPLWYYFGNDINWSDKVSELVTTIQVQAVNYDDDGAQGQYTMQLNTGLSTSNVRVPIESVTNLDTLSLTNPIVYDRLQRAFWLYKSSDIVSYAFYDSNGKYHELATVHADFGNDYLKLNVGMDTTVAGEELFLSATRGINFRVNYRKANRDIRLEFDYGSGLTVLPNYNLQTGDITIPYTGRIGNKFTIVNAERYLKNDWLFYGWRLQGDDDPDRIYVAGESFTIPYLDTDVKTTLHFEAVWRMSRLLYDFDFDGGHWDGEPDFSDMKGAYGNTVQIVPDIPVRFGYNFVGWRLNDETTLREPGSDLTVGTKIQTLHAQWEKKKMTVTFYTRIDSRGQWQPDRLNDNLEHKVGDTIRLITMKDNTYYKFLGWRVGDTVLAGNTTLNLDTTALLALDCIDRGDTVDVSIYAEQEKITLAVSYYLRYQDNQNQTHTELITPSDDWVTTLTPGDDQYFYSYAPFNKTNSREMQMRGSEFLGWDYEIIRRNGTVAASGEINAQTTVPAGYQQVRVYTRLQAKDYVIEYYGFEQNLLLTDTHDGSGYHYEDTIDLLSARQANIPTSNDNWGTFVGWSFEPDYKSGNPEVVYDVLRNNRPRLQIANHDEDYLTNGALFYAIHCDQHDEKIGTAGKKYRLRLYAIYAQDFVQLAYSGLAQDRVMICPVFVGDDRSASVMGGTTVGSDGADFVEWGLTVRDDADLATISERNFVGWSVTVDAGVKPSMKNYLENKLWLPGEALPAVDFGLNFKAEYVRYGTENLQIGNTVYRVRSLSPTALKNPQMITDVDVVALPHGNYTVPAGTLTINSDQKVHVVVSANGDIVLAPMAIKCDQVTDFYVGDNLTITGSPIYGANFQKYLVKKGYRLWNRDTTEFSDYLNHTQKYNYTATNQGLLLDNDGVLLGVPSHTQLTTAELRAALTDANYGIKRIANYALVAVNSLTTIDLAKDNLTIDGNALFSTYAQTIILPLNSETVSDEVIAGWQYRLTRVRFGDADTSQGSYAFVADGILYYGTTKEHVMYVLPSATTTNLQYSANDLRFADTVNRINKYALAARFLADTTWGRINSITAENVGVDLTQLIGLPATMPRFVDRNNPFKGPMIQSYIKHLQFTCDDYKTVVLSYAYGQTFTVFNPQNDNPHNFIFDRPWYNFVGWTSDNNFYRVGETYRVGVNDKMVGDGYTITLDASHNESWKSYPVRFHYFDGTYDLEFEPEGLLDTAGITHTMQEIYTDPNFDLSVLYLPGIEQTFTKYGTKYQFVGWGIKDTGSELSMRLWSNVAVNARLLPDKTRSSSVAQGIMVDGAYNYYALYDKVSDNLGYTLTNDGYSVFQNSNANSTKIYIPYAKYNNGYMVPITKVNSFNGLANIDEILIGGAVSEIGISAFEGVNATVTFLHQGQYIQYNNNSSLRQLTIGDRAFLGNNKLSSIYLPNATVSIGTSAFEKCTALTDVLFAPEVGVTPSLNRLGDTVFRDDKELQNLAIVTLIMNDRAGAQQRFYEVGNGIFTNTKVRPVGQNKIVWLGTLLHAYNGSGQLIVSESKIAGYAFANLNDMATTNPVTSIVVNNANAMISANAFANLSSSVTEINLVLVNPRRVNVGAFNNINHKLTVRVGDVSRWQDIIGSVKNSNITFI